MDPNCTEESLDTNCSATDLYVCDTDTTNFELFGMNVETPSSLSAYSSLAILDILVIIIPSVILSTLTMVFLFQSKNKHPSTYIFMWICGTCIAGSCSFAILMDISLLIDQPVLGLCKKRGGDFVYWFMHSALHTFPLWLLGIASLMLYLSVRKPNTNVSVVKLNIALLIVFFICAIETAGFSAIFDQFVDNMCHIRGSFCVTLYSHSEIVLVLEVARITNGFIISAAVVCTSMTLFVMKVKKDTIARDRHLIQSIMRTVIATYLATFLATSPAAILFFSSFRGTQRGYIQLLSTYTLRINYVLFPLIILTIHKQTKEKICSLKMRFFKSKRGLRRIVPEVRLASSPK